MVVVLFKMLCVAKLLTVIRDYQVLLLYHLFLIFFHARSGLFWKILGTIPRLRALAL